MAKFNFEKALTLSKKVMESKAIECIVLAPSGGGKSSIMGTFGVPTLYIYSTGESHGPGAAHARAQETGSTVLPVCMDLDDDGNKIEPDAVLDRILDILSDESIFDQYGIKAVAIDGAAELENYILASKRWGTMCLTDKGKHNSYAETTMTCALFRPIFNRLKELQRTRNIHLAITAMVDVQVYGEMNDIVECAPRSKGYNVAVMLIQQFGDVVLVGPMTKDKVTKHKLQFMTDMGKVSKDLQGNVKKTINFKPRLKGVTKLPSYLDADFRAVLALKEKDESKAP